MAYLCNTTKIVILFGPNSLLRSGNAQRGDPGTKFFHFYTNIHMQQFFFAAKLYYMMQMPHCARSYIQVFHRTFAFFIWDFGSEPVRRDNKWWIRLDTFIFIWSCAPILSFFFFYETRSIRFLRTVIQAKLAASLPNFVISSHGQQSPRLVGWFALVADSFLFLGVSFSIRYLSTVSRKRLSADLRETVFPAPIYRALLCESPGQDILCRVKKMCIPTRGDILF